MVEGRRKLAALGIAGVVVTGCSSGGHEKGATSPVPTDKIKCPPGSSELKLKLGEGFVDAISAKEDPGIRKVAFLSDTKYGNGSIQTDITIDKKNTPPDLGVVAVQVASSDKPGELINAGYNLKKIIDQRGNPFTIHPVIKLKQGDVEEIDFQTESKIPSTSPAIYPKMLSYRIFVGEGQIPLISKVCVFDSQKAVTAYTPVKVFKK